MTREEKARSLGQIYFPDEANIWARPNYEAQFVSNACMQMAEWEHKRLIEKACDWLVVNAEDSAESALYLVAKFKQAMEE